MRRAGLIVAFVPGPPPRKPNFSPPGQGAAGLSDYARRILAGELAPEEVMGCLERQAWNEITIAYGGGGGGGCYVGGGGSGTIAYGGGGGGAGTYNGRRGCLLWAGRVPVLRPPRRRGLELSWMRRASASRDGTTTGGVERCRPRRGCRGGTD